MNIQTYTVPHVTVARNMQDWLNLVCHTAAMHLVHKMGRDYIKVS